MKHSRITVFQKALPVLTLLCLVLSIPATAELPAVDDGASTDYVRTTPSRDGIGKRYMGREISRVMGHQGAAWLERDNRERQERTEILVAALGLQPTDVVADIGYDPGYGVAVAPAAAVAVVRVAAVVVVAAASVVAACSPAFLHCLLRPSPAIEGQCWSPS